ncbi:hypothetical protein ACFQY4_18010 [Catellatospora bangladeshensis]|uniref:Uncharacterized protein n=1 Tax=Catellatospora bangladeshensis TaxID=310355 RepID=A0A8J3NIE9_9ACTN|nr:hypothetical protein [Catellatospora bangladeshensis]GIF82092.1 hypothetical protein Cba03nite_34410 [Catellatospora bangladeshensis]
MTAPDGAFDIVAFGIGDYLRHPPLRELDGELAAIGELLSEVGGADVDWPVPARRRTKAEVVRRLGDWAQGRAGRSSVLLWVGHGESNDQEAWLAAYDTAQPMDDLTAIRPDDLRAAVLAEWRSRAQHGDDNWTVLVIEACGGFTFTWQLAQLVYGIRPDGPQRLAIVGVGGTGRSYLGQFRRALAATLAMPSMTDNDSEIRLDDLVSRVQRRLPDGHVVPIGLHLAAPLIRRERTLTQPVTAPLDIYAELTAALARLSPDERGHFLPKAQGAELGELAWYFCGRAAERREISRWLRERTTGMLVVTGPAGSGKSALLGNILVHANPDLRAHLGRTVMLDVLPEAEQPPDNPFDVVMHLIGMSVPDVVVRIADAVGLQLPPGGDRDTGWLLRHLADHPVTVLADALDEAHDPQLIAATVLRGIAAVPGNRVVVGTRRSGRETIDDPAEGQDDLVRALGVSPDDILLVDRDPQAIAAYVASRLRAALHEPDPAVLDQVARAINGGGRQFLYARLAVHEIIAGPQLLQPHRREDLGRLLRSDHRGLFAAAVSRLVAASPRNGPLLRALSLAHGRGVPRADQVWALMAEALSERGDQIGEQDVDDLLTRAAAYVMLDAEAGQSVFRLAHRTFAEFFRSGPPR